MASETASRVREVVIVLAVFVLVGAGCGWVWHALWAPAPTGVVVSGEVYFSPDQEFAGTALYMFVAAGAGIGLGVVFAWVFEHDELVTLAAVVAGAALAGVVMAAVGHWLGPESVGEVAARTEDLERVADDLGAGPVAAYAAFPGGALIGVVVVLVMFAHRGFTGEPRGVGSPSQST